MRASSCPSAILLLGLSCLGLACEAKSAGATAEPAAGGPPVANEPVPEKETKADDAPPSKCFADGGTCVAPSATLACKRFEEGEEWGCTDEGTGCCFQ